MKDAAPSHVAITGGGGGIGSALALAFSRLGARVALSGRNIAPLQRAAAACPGPTSIHACDVTQAEQVEAWLLACDGEAPVDCVVACAGLGGEATLAGLFGESGAMARRILEANTVGVVNTVTPLLERMTERRCGRIVIISSVAGLIALPDSPAYCASKAAVVAYGEALRRLLRGRGVSVTTVCPGFVDTDMARSLPMRPPFMWSSEKAAEAIVAGVLKGRPLVIFPWQLRCGAFASRVLPRPLVDRILDRLRVRTFQK